MLRSRTRLDRPKSDHTPIATRVKAADIDQHKSFARLALCHGLPTSYGPSFVEKEDRFLERLGFPSLVRIAGTKRTSSLAHNGRAPSLIYAGQPNQDNEHAFSIWIQRSS